MTNDLVLAHFLRSRRDQLRPGDVGLPDGGRRRVAGLRRNEVAMLAGISAEYYVRIEQGRERNPSDSVLDGIAAALQLSDDAATYMRNLARAQPAKRQRQSTRGDLDPAISDLIGGWSLSAAQVCDRTLTVVTANPLARALTTHFDPGSNIIRALFLDPALREFYRDWEKLTGWAVRWLRAFASQDPDPGLVDLIRELRIESRRFCALWSGHDVKHFSNGLMRVTHPQVGRLDLRFQHMVLPGSGHVLVAYWADPGSPSEDGLRELSRGEDRATRR